MVGLSWKRGLWVAVEGLEAGDPAVVGGYRLRGRLGAGGMGVVYLASTATGGRLVALKVVRPDFGGDPEFRARFRQEVDAARRVHGLFTAQVLDADPDGSPPWLVTAYVAGPSLAHAVTARGPLPEQTVLGLVAGVAEALAAIHGAGVVHRDLKPSNVLLAADGPRVIDFGIARAAEATELTRTGMMVGSPQYMSPEQVRGDAVGPATDVWALGEVAVFAATGRSPFGAGKESAVLYRVLHQAPDLSGCPTAVREVVGPCLEADPAARPSPAELIAACQARQADPAAGPADSGRLPPELAADLAGHAAVVRAPTAPAAGLASATAGARPPTAPAVDLVGKAEARSHPAPTADLVEGAAGAKPPTAPAAPGPAPAPPGSLSTVTAVPSRPPRAPAASPAIVAPSAAGDPSGAGVLETSPGTAGLKPRAPAALPDGGTPGRTGRREPSLKIAIAAIAAVLLLAALAAVSLQVLPDPLSPRAAAGNLGSEAGRVAAASPSPAAGSPSGPGRPSGHAHGTDSKNAGTGGKNLSAGSSTGPDRSSGRSTGGVGTSAGSSPAINPCLIGTWKGASLKLYYTEQGDGRSLYTATSDNWTGSVIVYSKTINANGSFSVKYNDVFLESSEEAYVRLTGTVTGSETTGGGQELNTYTSDEVYYADDGDDQGYVTIGGNETYSCSGNTLTETIPGLQIDTMTRES